MTLGEKLRYLRLLEGTLRGLDREMSQAELSRAIAATLARLGGRARESRGC